MRRLVIAVLVLLGLLVVADFGAAALAESVVSRQMRSQLGLADDPSVRINGFPFLVQAVSGEYSSIDVNAQRIEFGELKQLGVTAQLRNVTAPPLPALLGSGPKSLQVQAAEGTVRVPADDVQRLVPGIQKLRLEPLDDGALQRAIDNGGDVSLGDLDPDDTVRLVGTTTLAGRDTEVAVIASMQLDTGQVTITPRDIRVGGDDARPLPAPLQAQLQRMFTLRIDPGALPLEVTPTRLRATPDGALEISGRARNLTLGGAAAAAGN